MKFRTVVFVAIALLIVGVLLAPITPAYVTSDSMEPTIDSNDLYFVVPSDGVETGEIITFYSPVKERYITHRVVGTTEAGYITKGDNNPQPDQTVTEPPVTPDRIRGELLSAGDDPVVIPGAAPPVRWIEAHQLELAIGLGWLLVVSRIRRSYNTRNRRRTNDQGPPAGTVVGLVALVVFVVCFSLVLVGGSAHAVTLQASPDASTGSGPSVPTDQQFTREFVYKLEFMVPFHTVVRADGAAVRDTWSEADTYHIILEAGPYAAAGTHRISIEMMHYPLTLPPPAIEWLHGIHPLLAVVTTVGVVVIPFYLLGRVLVPRRAPVTLRRGNNRA